MMRESPMSDEGWPKRKRSDLMAHMTPNHGIRIGLNEKKNVFWPERIQSETYSLSPP